MTDLRTLERESIRAFVQSAADEGYLSGRVLDYGCGKQPHRDIVEAAGGEYEGYDRVEFGGNVSGEDIGFVGIANWMWNFDAILCTQVVQYVPLYGDVGSDQCTSTPLWDVLWQAKAALENNQPGALVLSYGTNWPEVEPEDLHRFTKAGMERLLTEAGFEIVRHEPRAWFDPWGGFISPAQPPRVTPPDVMAFGYGVICRA